MQNKIMYPSLSEDGWVKSSVKIADKLLCDWFESDFSQSYLYSGLISSLPYIIQNKQGNVAATADEVRLNLTAYFRRYFNDVVVESTDNTSADNPSKGSITLYIKFTDSEGSEYVIGRLFEIADMAVTKIIDLNNGS